MIRKKDLLILLLCFVIILVIMALVAFAIASQEKAYKATRIEGDDVHLSTLFLNSKITVKNNVLVAKQGKNTMIVLELKENNKTGLNDYTYAYTKGGIKLVYQDRVMIYLKEV